MQVLHLQHWLHVIAAIKEVGHLANNGAMYLSSRHSMYRCTRAYPVQCHQDTSKELCNVMLLTHEAYSAMPDIPWKMKYALVIVPAEIISKIHVYTETYLY